MLCVGLIALGIGLGLGGGSPARGQFGGTLPESSREVSPSRSKGPAKVLQVVLREGTEVGPVRGRFVLRGHRWTFLGEDENSNSAELSKMIDGGIARKVTEPISSVLGRGKQEDGLARGASGVQPNGNTPSFAGSTVGQAKRKDSRPRTSIRAAAFHQMIVLENLMLDRIASAIDQDPDDDTWTITGRVTEFQDENRLLLVTAHRAAAFVDR